ncbi:MAG: carbamoyltransferase HypF [Paracoccaceae bacterium]|nr:carbamoyltransferase HypF [Paracoccaceae bacterium]
MNGRRIRVRGQVQGVGFRPFVWQVANRFGLVGEVMNDAEGVLIFAAGDGLDGFEAALKAEAPPLARVDAIESALWDVESGGAFVISQSGGPGAETRVTPDAATCPDCVSEIFQTGARREGYAFTNCTHCGPRFTILKGLPYDRAQTSMAPFEMCGDCAAEYADPADRRFHAQPVACPACGPRLWFEVKGEEVEGDPIALAARAIGEGRILAVKGLGGFHLCCYALDAAAVRLLRDRKRRPAKPLAIMASRERIAEFAELTDDAMAMLSDPAAPIVLLKKQGAEIPEEIAPGVSELGVLLPYTPLHHLLLAACDGGPLVMTSGNLSGEPQVVGNKEARQKLSGFADAFLMHDREIARRLDDGVERAGTQGRMVLRRARGRVPGTLPIPEGLPDRQVVAYGGQLKSAICLVKNGQALLSHHMGDLDDALSVEEFVKADADYAALFDHAPAAVAVDFHPDFRASAHGRAKAEAMGLQIVEVQHHHAHMAAALGEAGWSGGQTVGIILDGLGLGSDGTVWGGEVLVGGYGGFTRTGFLKPAPLPGGDLAQMEPWRNAVMRLDAAGFQNDADRLFGNLPRDAIRAAAAAGVNAPQSSSMGRLFDAVAACLGITPDRQSFEGEAAMRLEALALGASPSSGAYPYVTDGEEIDPAPMFEALLRDLKSGAAMEDIAARFHRFAARAFADAARVQAEAFGTDTIAISGGCFQNALLLDLVCDKLKDLAIYLPREAPANDGGLAYGQALVALARMESA